MTTIVTCTPQNTDSQYSPELIEYIAEQVHRNYLRLITVPAARVPGYDDVITLHALREAMWDTPHELLDAVLRHLDAAMIAEVTEADEITPEDEAAGVWITLPEDGDELAYEAHHIGWIEQ